MQPTPRKTTDPPALLPAVSVTAPTSISLHSISEPKFFSSLSAPEFPLPPDGENEPHVNGVRPRSGAISYTSSVRRCSSDLSGSGLPKPNLLSMSCSDLPAPSPAPAPGTGTAIAHHTVYPPILPVLPHARRYQEISESTFANLINGAYQAHFKRVIIIDCRSTLEYDAGHIRNAISIVPTELEQKLQELFMTNPTPHPDWAIVFHCEYSAVRGPHAWQTLRDMDRTAFGVRNYPRCYYPYMYVLNGGFRRLFQVAKVQPEYGQYITGDYVAMSTKDSACDRILSRKSLR